MTSTASRRALQGGGATTAAAAATDSAATTSVTSIPAGVIADERWPKMYRVKLGRGRLSDMLNLARARDVLASRK